MTGVKSVTRRLNGLGDVNELPDAWEFISLTDRLAKFHKIGTNVFTHHKAPYGGPGDTIWVRENWFVGREYNETPAREIPRTAKVGYAADFFDIWRPNWAGRVRPSIHMPKWMCRAFLDVTGVGIERLHDITEDGAKAEGVPKVWQDKSGTYWVPDDVSVKQIGEHGTYRSGFEMTWTNLNGPESWELNPWVWVISFNLKNQSNDHRTAGLSELAGPF